VREVNEEQESRVKRVRDQISEDMERIAEETFPEAPYSVSTLPGWNCLLTAVARAIVRETEPKA